eukprot:9151676-Prorocentrum_lima.AAC.1
MDGTCRFSAAAGLLRCWSALPLPATSACTNFGKGDEPPCALQSPVLKVSAAPEEDVKQHCPHQYHADAL